MRTALLARRQHSEGILAHTAVVGSYCTEGTVAKSRRDFSATSPSYQNSGTVYQPRFSATMAIALAVGPSWESAYALCPRASLASLTPTSVASPSAPAPPFWVRLSISAANGIPCLLLADGTTPPNIAEGRVPPACDPGVAATKGRATFRIVPSVTPSSRNVRRTAIASRRASVGSLRRPASEQWQPTPSTEMGRKHRYNTVVRCGGVVDVHERRNVDVDRARRS